MGQLTLRQIHLLQAEWVLEKQLDQLNTYKLMCMWGGKDFPKAEEFFPMLKGLHASNGNKRSADLWGELLEEAREDDGVIFGQVAAVLGAVSV